MADGSEDELQSYLNLAVREAGVSVTELLCRVLHVGPKHGDGQFQAFFADMAEPIRALLSTLDYRLKVLNPGLHYAYRSEYLGYRREGAESLNPTLGRRSQIFVSVLRRAYPLQVVMPLSPDNYSRVPGCRDMNGMGHHGVGNLHMSILDSEDLELFFSTFSTWLRPSNNL